MNLLEKMKLIVDGSKMALEDSPAICRAVLAAMDELESGAKECRGIIELGDGFGEALSILRKHLGIDE